MGMWELLSTLDSDPEIDAFPGFLVASNEKNVFQTDSAIFEPCSRCCSEAEAHCHQSGTE